MLQEIWRLGGKIPRGCGGESGKVEAFYCFLFTPFAIGLVLVVSSTHLFTATDKEISFCWQQDCPIRQSYLTNNILNLIPKSSRFRFQIRDIWWAREEDQMATRYFRWNRVICGFSIEGPTCRTCLGIILHSGIHQLAPHLEN